MTPDVLAGEARTALASDDVPIQVLWCRVEGNREEFARELRALLSDLPVVVLPVRGVGFWDPNSVFDDLVDLLSANRPHVEGVRALRDSDRVVIVLLSRTELAIPQISSPAVLPSWFPVQGGLSLKSRITDVSWRAAISLSDPLVAVPNLCERLYEFERVCIHRLRLVHSADIHAVQGLVALRRKETSAADFGDVLTAAEESHQRVLNPSSYRPSLRNHASIVSQVWWLYQTLSSENRRPAAKAFARALDLGGMTIEARPTLVAVLHRPTNLPMDKGVRMAEHLIASVGSACQLVTAAAHADQYEAYPETLLRSVSYDLRTWLSDFTFALRSSVK
jgi:hypothetical protein